MFIFRKILILRFFSDNANEESDGDLFVAQEVASSRKRPHSMVADDEGDLVDEVGSSAG